jgi:hypothetical protein
VVVVSLTSFPAAITFAARAVKSILDGSVKPDRVVLYLAIPQFPDGKIPADIAALAKEYPIFEVRFCEQDIKSYKKLIPALKDFANDIIVTVDDDVLYHKNTLRNLLRVHERYPDTIIAHRVKRLKLNTPYRKWRKYRWYRFFMRDLYPKFSNMHTGCGGVLYPPNCLKKEMLDPEIFTQIAPTVDDVWFWAAAVANGTKIAPVPFGYSKPRGLGKPKDLSLKKLNVKSGKDVNREVLEKIIEKYPVIKRRLEDEG